MQRREDGKLFHVTGAATANDLSLNVLRFVRGMSRRMPMVLEEERKPVRPVRIMMSSLRYEGARS